MARIFTQADAKRLGLPGRTALEISEEEGIPLGTAKTRIRTGLIRLRASVEHSREIGEER